MSFIFKWNTLDHDEIYLEMRNHNVWFEFRGKGLINLCGQGCE